MCRKCVGHFLNVRTYYHALEHSETAGMNCKSILTSQDKVEIVKATYAYIVGDHGLWSKGFCSSCYTKPLTHESKLTTITNEFFALAEAVLDCFDEHPNASYPLEIEEQSGACTSCRADYLALNHFYKEKIFQAQFPQLDGICFDILDMMNSTQRRWGREHYGCVRKMHGNAPLILAIIFILLTPVAFYGGAWYFGKAAVERAVTTSHMTDLLVDITADEAGGHGMRVGQDQMDGWNGHEHGWQR